MASVNPHTRELVFKLVFYGPGLGGKTTTLQYIHAATKAELRGKMVSLATPTDRTLYFDFLPIRVPRVRGMAVRLQLFTVPGQVYYAATRKLVLSGADGVVFVADSQNGRIEVNQESLDDLHSNLGEHNRTLEETPHTFHWNKRDLGDLLSIEELDRRFNVYGAPSLGTVATKGEGVFDGLERITRLVLKAYEKDPKVRIEGGEPRSERDQPSEPRIETDGIAQALRQMESSGVEPPTKISQVVPDPIGLAAFAAEKFARREKVASDTPASQRAPSDRAASDKAPSDRASSDRASSDKPRLGSTPSDKPRLGSTPSDKPRLGSTPSDKPRLGSTPSDKPQGDSDPRMVKDSAGWPRFTLPEAGAGAPGVVHAPVEIPRADGYSLAELWPDTEREGVRQAEAMIAARDAVNAILACDVLVTRVLASAAGLVGTLDAPRDPALVSLLLGLDGPRYLHFRTFVRKARHREPVTMKDALECFAFSIEARRAREALRR